MPTRRPTATASAPLPAVQARALETSDRLLDAAEAVLAADGLVGATVPAIAERAGVAVGTVYKRFPDKDALLRCTYERAFLRAAEGNRAALAPERWVGWSAARLTRVLVGSMVSGYRRKQTLLAALARYAETHPDAAFRRRADELTADAFDRVGALLLARRDELRHPDPEGAVRLGLLTVGLALRGVLLRGDDGALHPFDGDDDRFAAELSRQLLAYLGASGDDDDAIPARRSRSHR